MKELRKLPYVIVKNDKLPGYSFVSKSELSELVALETLALPVSSSVPVYVNPSDIVDVKKTIVSLAIRANDADPDLSIKSLICRTLGGQVACKLGYTIKTHKHQGEIKPRSLHLARNPLTHGLSAWICWKLRASLMSLTHMVWDCFQFKRAVEHLHVPAGARLCALDLKDFFLSGSANQLADYASLAIAPPHRQLVREAITTVLTHQYVQSSTANCLHRCVVGAGMGLKHSADIANLAFYYAVEKPCFDAGPQDLASRGVLSYSRYHDDVLLVCTDRIAMLNFVADLKSQCDIFKIVCREVSHQQLQHLDLTIRIEDGTVVVAPTLDKIPIPLAPDSAHPPHIHRGWPCAVYQRIAKLSGSCPISLGKLIADDRAAGADHFTIQQLRPPHSRMAAAVRHVPEQELIPIVLRYHPAFRGALARTLKQVPPPPSLNFRLVPSWTNALPSLSTHTHLARQNLPDATITG